MISFWRINFGPTPGSVRLLDVDNIAELNVRAGEHFPKCVRLLDVENP